MFNQEWKSNKVFTLPVHTAATCGWHLQGSVTGHWVIDLSKRRQNYFCGNQILKLNIAGRHVTYPAITRICDPFSAPCATGAHCLSCCPSRKWQTKSTAALGTTDSFWQTCMKDEYGLLTSCCCGELWREWLIICCISSRRGTASHFLGKWHHWAP